jgi:hypothetical protein
MTIDTPTGYQWFAEVMVAGDGTMAAATLILCRDGDDPCDIVRRHNPHSSATTVVPLSRLAPDDNSPVILE